MYNKVVTFSNGNTFTAKDVYLYESLEDQDNSRLSIIIDSNDFPYPSILELIGGNGDIKYVKVTEYKSIKVKGEYTTGDKIGDTMYDDYGVNIAINYNKNTDEYTIDLYKITDLVKANLDQQDRILAMSLGIIDTFEISRGEGDSWA